jgi:hypothetical protein
MKAILMVVVALTLFVEGVSAQITNLFIGNEEAVIQNGLVNARYVSIAVQQRRGNLYWGVSQDVTPQLVFTNKTHLDAVAADLLKKVAQGAIDNDAGQDKDGVFLVSVFVSRRYSNPGFTIAFLGGLFGEFKLVKSNGVYSLPDLSSFAIGVPVNVTYHFPSLKWARITTTDENGTRTVDSAVGDDSMFDFGRHAVFLPKDVALSGTTKISVIYGPDNVYASFDENGALLAEIPPSTKTEVVQVLGLGEVGQVTTTSLRLSFSGGDIGRSYEVETSPDLKTWTLVPETRFTVFYTFPYVEHTSLVVTGEGDNTFYRLRSVNRVPQYPK